MTRVARPGPSSCSAPPSSTAGRRRSSRPGSTTPSTSTEDMAPVLVVTGGKAEGDRTTEAAAARAYAMARGVPAAAISMEDEGRTTLESLQGVAACSATGASATRCSSAIRPTCCGSCGWPGTSGSSRTARRRGRARVESDPVADRSMRPSTSSARWRTTCASGLASEDTARGSLKAAPRRGPRPGPLPRAIGRFGPENWYEFRHPLGVAESAPILCEIFTPADAGSAPRRSRPCAPSRRPPSVNRTDPRRHSTRRGTS